MNDLYLVLVVVLVLLLVLVLVSWLFAPICNNPAVLAVPHYLSYFLLELVC